MASNSSTAGQGGGAASGSSNTPLSTPPGSTAAPTHPTTSTSVQPTTSAASPIKTTSTGSVPAHTSTTESTQAAQTTTAATSQATSLPATQSSAAPTPLPSTGTSTPSNSSPNTTAGSSSGTANTSNGGNSSPTSAPGTQIAPGSSSTQGKWTGPYSSIASTWVTVYGATPTTETFATQTTIHGSVVQTTEVLTTSHGGVTLTTTGFFPVTTGGGSVNNNSSPSAKAAHEAKIGGAVIGAIVAGGILLCLAFFGCRILHRRRVLLNREKQMSDGWLSRPFSRASPRHRYQDMDGGSGEIIMTEVPMTSMVANASSAAAVMSPSESPMTPISPIAFANAPSWADSGSPVNVADRAVQKRKGKPSLAAISGPVGPVLVEGEGDAMRNMISLQEAQTQRAPDHDPFLDDAEAVSIDYPATSALMGVEHGRESPRGKSTAVAGGPESSSSPSDDDDAYVL